MVSVLIVDDEKYVRRELAYLLGKHEDVKICAEAEDGEEALNLVEETKPDVVYLDIQLRDTSGLLVARRIREKGGAPLIVLATAFEQHAIQGFDIGVVDYLVKPFIAERVDSSLDRVREQLQLRAISKSSEEPENHNIAIQLDKLCVTKNNSLVLIDIGEVMYVQYEQDGLIVYTTNDSYKCSLSLKEFAEKYAQYGFIRTHKSFVVNIDFIAEIMPWFNYTYQLKLKSKNSVEVPVSRSYMKSFKRFLGIS